ncbi:MAG: protein-disulfide reductase DsbD domain-containing protein, partial [Gemmatimonas sp.]
MRIRPLASVLRLAASLAGSVAFALMATAGVLQAQSGGAAGAPDLTPNSEITLVSESNVFRPGTTTTVALRITMDAGWHTYWTNPGDAGLPLNALWTLPAGVTVSALRFPTPHVLPVPPLMSFGYEREVFVLADIAVAATLPLGTTLTLAADVDFLVCADVCLPASDHVALTVRTASQPAPTAWAPAIASTRLQLAQPTNDWAATAWRDGARLTVFARVPAALRSQLLAPYVIADSVGVLEHAAVQRVRVSGDTMVLALTLAPDFADSTSRFQGVLLTDVAAPMSSYQLDIPIVRARPRAAAGLVATIDGPQAITTGGAASNASVAVGQSDRAVAATPSFVGASAPAS